MREIAGLLIANRGEIAVRIARTAAEMDVRTVAVFSEDDADAMHVRVADEAHALGAVGVAAYLDVDRLLAVAKAAGCSHVHPGYGFLAERDAFAVRCAEAGLVLVGPTPETLRVLGDKVAARHVAARCDVPVPAGTRGPVTADEARAFLGTLGPGAAMVLKAVAGGGGRGMRVVRGVDEVEDAWTRCRSEAAAAFGNGDVYAEELLPAARHVEVQIAGDGTGAVVHLHERECTLQRRHQKLVEVAPAPALPAALRDRLLAAAVRIGREVRYAGLGTMEFLVDATTLDTAVPRFVFIEANPRLQVEHTVTEAVTGLDLVRVQLELATGRTLEDLGLGQLAIPAPRGFALQARVNAETPGPDGTARPASGTITVFEVPTGPGVRTDTAGHAGHRINPRFDPLLAKVIVHVPSPRFADVVAKARRALAGFRLDGVSTNLDFLQALLAHPDVAAGRLTTRFVETHAAALAATVVPRPAGAPAAGRAGARVDAVDPLAVLALGKSAAPDAPAAPAEATEPGDVAAPMQGTIVSVDVAEGARVRAGQPLLVMEAMKMEHVVAAPGGGVVRLIAVAPGEAVYEGSLLVRLALEAGGDAAATADTAMDLERIRPDLAELLARRALLEDAARPDAVAKRRATGQRTARENVADLCDPGSFVEYGGFAIAAQRRRRPVEELIVRTPADGLVAGIGRVNGDVFPDETARCAVLSYDYTVLAGTQGLQNHRKKDRLFALAERQRLPVVFFTEGGGGRPGDTDGAGVAGLDCMAFHWFGRLSGLVPLVGINSGRCFAGNAALLGCCDVVIATANSSIGMGGPAMIEGGGLGVFRPDEVGPMTVQVPNGVVDVAVADEAEAVAVARRYLSYFQGALPTWTCDDQRRLRHLVPENRLRAYDVRPVIATLADTGSVLELRRAFGRGMITALVRVEGRPLGIVANDPMHLGGAIDADGADKAARFLQLCDAHDLPVVFLCDTPGMMVGPEVEKTALVRHCSRLFVVGGSLTVPYGTIVLRKGYGLGAQAMAGGSFHAPLFTVAWPTGEFGGMGLEGAVKLGFRNELAAVADPVERRRLFDEMVARMYEHGKALSMASYLEIDDVIDPAESRARIAHALRASPPPAPRTGKKRPCVDTW